VRLRRRALAALASLVGIVAACGKKDSLDPAPHPAPSASAALPQRDAGALEVPGMAWIPPGTLRAGTPVGVTPRIADEELPGVPIAMQGFYIDLLPYPNEPGAIPTANVTRDEADKLCAAKGKRLCTELEWERACKGEDNHAYEYGDTYREAACGTGVTPEEAAKRPSGDRHACKSGFGVQELHGGVWEWTSSAWGRGSRRELGTLRGGNAQAGELVGRCANALGRTPSHRAPTMGLRCCKGESNTAKVELSVAPGGPPLEVAAKPDAARLLAVAQRMDPSPMSGARAFHPTSVWTWRPSPGERLTIASGCADYVRGRPKGCVLLVVRDDPPADEPLAAAAVDVGVGEVALAGDARHARIRAIDTTGVSVPGVGFEVRS
jgi:formylglycine-generating enzyme required for sulfatase activity